MVRRRLWFMGRPLPVRQKLMRLWRTGTCTFSDVTVNEHPLVAGRIGTVRGDLEHLDSPDLEHWRHKQDRYSTAEALAAFRKAPLSAAPNLFGNALQRRMWLKNALQPPAVSPRADVRLLPAGTGRLARGCCRRRLGARARRRLSDDRSQA